MIQGVQRPHGPWTLFAFLHETPNSVGLAATYSAEAYKIKFVLMPLPQAWVASIIGMNSAAIFPSMRMQSENEFPQTHLWTH